MLLSTVEMVRAKYPALVTDYQAGMIVNEVAWFHKEEGWGVARKNNGASAMQVRTGIPISRDLLVLGDTMYDCLIDVSGGRATAAWSVGELRDLPWVAPARPLDIPVVPRNTYDDGYDDGVADALTAIKNLQ